MIISSLFATLFFANTTLVGVPKLEQDAYDWYARHERILKEAKAINPDLVLIGDSLTHHWAGLNSIGEAKDANEFFLQSFKGQKVLDLGFGWDRIQNILWRVENGELAGLNPKQIVLLAGTNNLADTPRSRANSAEEIFVGITNLATKIQHKCPKAKLTIVSLLPRGRAAEDKRIILKEVNRRLSNQAAFQFLDLWSDFVDKNEEVIRAYYRPDLLHLSPAGYQVWSKRLINLR